MQPCIILKQHVSSVPLTFVSCLVKTLCKRGCHNPPGDVTEAAETVVLASMQGCQPFVLLQLLRVVADMQARVVRCLVLLIWRAAIRCSKECQQSRAVLLLLKETLS